MFLSTIRALLSDVLDPTDLGLDSGCLQGASADMEDCIRAMPRYMGAGIAGVTFTAGVIGYPMWNRERRLRWLGRLRGGRVGPLRDWVEFFEKMGTFTYFSRLENLGSYAQPPSEPG